MVGRYRTPPVNLHRMFMRKPGSPCRVSAWTACVFSAALVRVACQLRKAVLEDTALQTLRDPCAATPGSSILPADRSAELVAETKKAGAMAPAVWSRVNYFFEHVAHLSQVVPASVQHFMPQLGLLEQLALLLHAQPTANAATHKDRAITLRCFMVLICDLNSARGITCAALMPEI